MEPKQRSRIAGRFSLLALAITTVVWIAAHFIRGGVPVIHEIVIWSGSHPGSSWSIVLPFGISRWWDILFVPIVTVYACFILTDEQALGSAHNRPGFTFGMIFGAWSVLMFVLRPGSSVGLAAWVGVALAVLLVAGASTNAVIGLRAAASALLGAWLIFLVTFSVFYGPVVGSCAAFLIRWLLGVITVYLTVLTPEYHGAAARVKSMLRPLIR